MEPAGTGVSFPSHGEGLGPGKQAAEDSVKHSCHKMQRREGYWEHLSIKKGEKKKR